MRKQKEGGFQQVAPSALTLSVEDQPTGTTESHSVGSRLRTGWCQG